MLKQDSREHEQTWDSLTMVRAFSQWRKHSLGEMSNSRSLVNNWRQLLVLWMRNYPTELTSCSIYSRLERWPMNLGWARWRSEKKWVSGTVIRGLLPWQALRRSPGMHNTSDCDMVIAEARGVRSAGGQLRWIIWTGRKAERGCGGQPEQCPYSIAVKIFLPWGVIGA
jgi:hypothetical protein